jgi:hypothetical protein
MPGGGDYNRCVPVFERGANELGNIIQQLFIVRIKTYRVVSGSKLLNRTTTLIRCVGETASEAATQESASLKNKITTYQS